MMRRARLALSSMPCLLAVAWPGLAAAPAAPASATPSFGLELLAILLPLAFIIICLLVLLRVLRRRFGLTGADAPLSVVQVLPVGPRERIVVVRSRAGRAFAVGVAAGTVSLITGLDGEDLGPAAEPSTASGAGAPPPSVLQRYMVNRS